jgi:hypothetical protein
MARSIFILVVILSIGSLGCYTRIVQHAEQGDYWGKEYIARVYRVEGPDVVRPDGSFELRVFSDTECPNSFVRFEVAWEEDQASVVVIGVHPKEPALCPQDARPPEGQLLTITAPPYPRVEVVFNAGTDHEIRVVVVPIDRRPN